MRQGDREARDALADVDVEMVEPAAIDADDDLAWPGPRIVDLLELQDIGTTELVEPHSFHAIDLPCTGTETCVYV